MVVFAVGTGKLKKTTASCFTCCMASSILCTMAYTSKHLFKTLVCAMCATPFTEMRCVSHYFLLNIFRDICNIVLSTLPPLFQRVGTPGIIYRAELE